MTTGTGPGAARRAVLSAVWSAARSAARAGARAAVLAGVAGALAWACSSTPLPPLPRDALDELQAGATTMNDAQALLGNPGETEELPDGTKTWIYTYSPTTPTEPDPPPPSDEIPRYDVLRLIFRPDGVLASHEVTRLVAQPRRAGVHSLKAIGSP